MRCLVTVYLILFGFSEAKAQTGLADNLYLKFLCASNWQKCKNMEVSSLPSSLKLAINTCEILSKTTVCQKVAKEPEFQGRMRKCTPDQFCEDNFTQELSSISSCGEGALLGLGEKWTSALEQLKNGIKNIEAENKIIAECKSLECKRERVRHIPKFQNMSDEILEKYSAAALETERNNFKYIESTQRRHSQKNLFPGERAEEAELRHVEGSPASTNELILSVAEWLKDEAARLQCVDAKTRAEMLCWGAAYILDPSLVAFGVLKGNVIANFINKLASKRAQLAHPSKSLEASAERMDAKIRAKMSAPGIDYKELKKNMYMVWDDPNIPVETKLKSSFEEYIRLRSESLPPDKKELLEKSLQNIQTQPKSTRAEYNKATGQILVGDRISDDLLSYYQVVVHEAEHLTQSGVKNVPQGDKVKKALNAYMNKSTQKADALKSEFEAIGAQWDFLQSIPPEVRKQSFDAIRNNKNLPQSVKVPLLADIKNATLTRQEYIKTVPKAHGYASIEEAYMQRTMRTVVIGASALGAYGTYTEINDK